jgi:hypothetical protein
MPPTVCFWNIANPTDFPSVRKKSNLSTLRSGGPSGLETIYTPHQGEKVVVNSHCSDGIFTAEQSPLKILWMKISDSI